jgi:hypothetical protein
VNRIGSLLFALATGVAGVAHAQPVPAAAAAPTVRARPTTGSVTRSITRAKAEMMEDLMGPKRKFNWRTAANMLIIPHREIAKHEKLLQDSGDYGSHQFKRVRVTGLGPSAEYRADFLGSVSAHDMKSLSPTKFKAAIAARAASDGITIILENSAGSQTLVENYPSELVTQLPLKFNLTPGVNRVTYLRTDRVSGRIVSQQGGYDEGRVLEIEWDGVTSPTPTL